MAENENIPIGQKGISEEIIKNEEEPLKKLQKQASLFLDKVSLAVSNLMEINKSFDDKNVPAIYSATRQTIGLAREITSKQYDFEIALNNFLNRQINLIWISEEGEIYYASQLVAKEIYVQGNVTERGRLGISMSQAKIDTLISFDKHLESFKDRAESLKDRKDDYKGVKDEVVNRWEWNHNPLNSWYNKEEENGYPYRDTFWWYIDKDHYEHSVKMSRGNIYEAYISIIFDKEEPLKSFQLVDNNDEQNVQRYWNYMQSRNILNNVPGIAEGDVVFDNIYQYAVKEGSFNTAALGPYIVAAFNILQLEVCTPNNVENTVLKNINSQSFRNKIKDKGFQNLIKEVQDIIDQYKEK